MQIAFRTSLSLPLFLPLVLPLVVALALTLPACTTRPSSDPSPDSSRVTAEESAVEEPQADLNRLRTKIPQVLEAARKAPYATPNDRLCNKIADEVAALDDALGADLDSARSAGTLIVDQGAHAVNTPPAEAAENFATGWMPHRSWAHRLTDTERRSRVVASAVRAGLVRRAWLKGLGGMQHCAYPASPLVPLTAGAWRFTHAQPAPWDPANPLGPDLRGQVITISDDSFQGPAYLQCERATFSRLTLPAEGLFEGGLPAPAETAANSLGLAHFPVATTRVTCANAGFDLHQVDPLTVLIGLDNRVWTLSQTAGTESANSGDNRAAGLVQLLLETHFSETMGFVPDTTKTKWGYFSRDLKQAIEGYFAVQRPVDEVPPINGDPFTDSQEYPTRFAVTRVTGDSSRAGVEVVFANAFNTYPLVYLLVREPDGWKLDNIVYSGGYTFLKLLTMP